MASIPLPSFDTNANLYGGQSFMWRPGEDGWHYGVLSDKPVRLRWARGMLQYEGVTRTVIGRHLRLDDDLAAIKQSLEKDPVMRKAIAGTDGLRLLRLSPWEGLMSFVCGSFSSIKRITRSVQSLCENFGEPLAGFHGVTLYALPEPESIAEASLGQLRACNLGYRDGYLKSVANAVVYNGVDPDGLARMPYAQARETLMELSGIGPKVADCICLLGLGHTDAFPIDVWIERGLRMLYGPELRACFGDSPMNYARLSQFARGKFGALGGYAQNYLFSYARRTLPKGA